jgi:uncharacterized protein (TIGR03083 family)
MLNRPPDPGGETMQVTQKEIAAAMRDERTRLVAYLEDLPEAAWDKESLCEGWRVRDIVAHLIGNAADIVAQKLDGAGSPEYNQRQVDERAGRSPAELLAEWAEAGPAFEAGIESFDDALWNTPYLELGTVGQALQRLVEDIWVHAQDIRIPLGDGPVPGPGVDAVLDIAVRDFPARAARLAPDVGSVRITTGATTRDALIGDGTAVEVSGDAITLALAATGRVTLAKAQDDGEVSVTPSAPAGFADALNIYGP